MVQFWKIFSCFWVLCFSFGGVSHAQKINIDDYKNKAQAYAILSAQYSKDAYFYAQKGYFSENTRTIHENSDFGIEFAEIAIQYADSAVMVAHDSSEYAKTVMLEAQDYQRRAFISFKRIMNTGNADVIHELSEKAMFSMGNAIADAYKASLMFDSKEEIDLDSQVDEPLYASNKEQAIVNPAVTKSDRNITRLESDEFSYLTVKELYGKRLAELDDELISLNEAAKKSSGKKLVEIKNAIKEIKEEEELCFKKMRNSEDRLISVRNNLSEEMLKIVNKDIFTTEKDGFYSENIPVPVNAEVPKGLVYKVQIGFFKSQLPPDHFEGIFPLSSQKVDDVYYCYLAGNFAKYEDVKAASTAISEKGYTDSFVVAYIDGKKVPIGEALKKEKGTN